MGAAWGYRRGMRFGKFQFSLVMPWWDVSMLRHIIISSDVIMCPMAERAALHTVFSCSCEICRHCMTLYMDDRGHVTRKLSYPRAFIIEHYVDSPPPKTYPPIAWALQL